MALRYDPGKKRVLAAGAAHRQRDSAPSLDYTRKMRFGRTNGKGQNLCSAPASADFGSPDQLVAGLSTGVHLAISLFTSAASASGVRSAGPGITLPRSSSRLRTFSSSSALAAAALSFSMIGAGVPFGAKIAFQAWAWNAGRPASVVVGRSGKDGLRAGARPAKALMVPRVLVGR